MASLSIPTPSPIPSPSESSYSLSERINIATRPIHSQLNKLIVARIPLALPPFTTNPSTYISGLLHIAPIYITFETAWQSIIDAPRLPTATQQRLDSCDPEDLSLESKDIPILQNTNIPPLIHDPQVCTRTHSLLQHLRLPGLLRAGRLREDIRILTGTPEHRIVEQLETVSQNGKLAAFIAHTKRSVEAHPHVLLAYAWVLYMALFSGGRYLRAMLQEAGGLGHEFWNRDPGPVRPYEVTGERWKRRASRSDFDEQKKESATRPRRMSRSEGTISDLIPGLQFFNFHGDEDGEDIKLEFKMRIAESEILLIEGEKEDIITEAKEIFNFLIDIVGELDKVMADKTMDSTTELESMPRLRVRDGVSVTLERLSRKIQRPSDAMEGQKGFWKGLIEPLTKRVQQNDSPAEVDKVLNGQCTKDGEKCIAFNPVAIRDPADLSALRRAVWIPTLAIIGVFMLWSLSKGSIVVFYSK